MRQTIETFVQSLPKAETHLHLDGTLTPGLIRRLALQQGYPALNGKSLKQIAQLTVVSSPKKTLKEVLEVFHVIYPLLRSPKTLEIAAYELCRKAKKQNIRYVEVRFSPILCTTKNFTSEMVVEAVLRGLHLGKKDFGTKSGIILCLLRDRKPKENQITLETAKKFAGKGVVAIDLANDEKTHSLLEFSEYFREAKKAGLGTTCHAGEVYPAPDLKLALDLGIDRIGHGTHLIRYPDLLQEVVRRKIPIEINLTSNIRTGAVSSIKNHPARQFFEKGIPILFSTDDPGVFNIDLNKEYKKALDGCGFTAKEMKQITLNSINNLFLDRTEKKYLLHDFNEALDGK